jgi:hypothetical protein
MSAGNPPRTPAEEIAYTMEVIRQQAEVRSKVRFSRMKRRLAVAGLYLELAATVAWLVALSTNTVSGSKSGAALSFLIALQTIFFVVLTYSVGDLTKRNAALDERERAQRDHATALAYKILSAVVVVGGLSAIAANGVLKWGSVSNTDIELLVPLMWFTVSLPMAVLAWTLPDPEPDPEP